MASATTGSFAATVLEATGGADEQEAKQDFDTNADVLPSKRTKAPKEAEADPKEKPMSKRKRRKLEQLAKKHASRELRTQVLSELKSVQLTAEQARLMKPSQSTRVSRRDQVALGRQRLASGLTLDPEMKKLRRWATPAANGDDDKSENEDVSAQPETIQKPAVIPRRSAAESSSSGSAAGTLPAEPSKVPVPTPTEPNSANYNVASASPSQSEPVPPETGLHEQKRPANQETTSAREGNPALGESAAAAVPSQPLQPVRVTRTEQIEEQRSRLPAVMCEQEVVESVLSNDVILISGDTGCGKSTQVPQFLYEAGICNGDRHLIGVTQPRRVAAISVSQRVGDELNQPGVVGYQVRYDRSHCGHDARIKFMTDGILLRELQADFLCQKYTAIIIDEAHERGVNCDILIGLLSRAVKKRRSNYDAAVAAGRYNESAGGDIESEKSALPPPPLRLIIMSATLRVCDFTENKVLFPTPPPVVKIDARTFPVTVHFARRTEEDYIKAAHRMTLQLHRQLPPGSVLVFVTGRQEVTRLCGLLRRSAGNAAMRRSRVDAAEEDQEDAADAEMELLEGSDDEGGAFDDDLAPTSQACSDAEPKRRKKLRKNGQQKVLEADSTADGDVSVSKKGIGKKKKRKQQASALPASDASLPQAEACGAPKKKRKKIKSSSGAISAPAQAEPQESHENQPKKEDTDECEVSFRLDAEEDVVMLDPEHTSTTSEDAKDAEAKRQKKVNMNKLDKSRTAGGAFRGAGFGEGPIHVCPLYAQLPAREQLAAFRQPQDGERIVIVATNVAETSVTLPNVRYVIDAGQEKRRKYRAASGISAFSVERISKASADQRAGRAGRLGPGHSYRLYSAAVYENHMTQFAPIAVLHAPMDPVLLLIASLGVPYLDLFPWPTPPPVQAVAAAMRRLHALGALKGTETPAGKSSSANAIRCTQLGFRLAALPVAPRYAKMLLSAVTAAEDGKSHIISHACALVAALSVGNLISPEAIGALSADDAEDEAPQEAENELVRAEREAKRRLREAQGRNAPHWTQLKDDADGLLWLMGGYAWAASVSEEKADIFCRESRANSRQMAEAHSLMQQLGSLLQRRLSLDAAGIVLELPLRPKPPTPLQAQKLRSCVVDGLIDRVAVARPELGRNAFVCADTGPNVPVFVHSSSNASRHRPQPSLMVFNEIISSSRPFMRDCISVDPLLLSKRAPAGDCPLLKLGEFLAIPAPRYLRDQDSVLAFASPSYAPLEHALPTIELSVPADSIFRYKVFAKALLDGEVFAGVPPPRAQLLAKPAMVLHAPNNPRVMGIVGPLWESRIGSRSELLQRWTEDRRFLIEGYLKWLPAAIHDDVRMSWPPSGAAARPAGARK